VLFFFFPLIKFIVVGFGVRRMGGMFAIDAFEGMVVFMLYFLLVHVSWFVFVFGKRFESEETDGV